jgi:hypothetical protein
VNSSSTQIFEYTIDSKSEIWSPVGEPSLKYHIPNELNIQGLQKSLLELHSTIFPTLQELMKEELTNPTTKITFGENFKPEDFGKGEKFLVEYKKLRELIQGSKFKILSRGIFGLVTYTLKRKENYLSQLSKHFEKLLKDLPTNPRGQRDLLKYKEIIDNYGGFFINEAVFGGYLKHYNLLTEELLRARSPAWIKKEQMLLFMNRIGFTDETNWEDEFDKNKNEFFSFKGGDEKLQDKENVKKWHQSIPAHSELLSADLKLISDLISINPTKKSNLEKVLISYSSTGGKS